MAVLVAARRQETAGPENLVTSLTDQYLLAMQQAKSSGSGTDFTTLAVQAGGLLV